MLLRVLFPLIAFILVTPAAPVSAAEGEGPATSTPSADGPSHDEMADLATKLSNPVASLISVPFQNNFDFGGGPEDDGFQYKLNVQPVVPINLNDDVKMITRTIVPYIYQRDRIGT